VSLVYVDAPVRPAPLPPEVLADIATGIARVEDWWRPHAHHDPDERRPVRLLATDAYEVWVIGWTAGQGVELHDHGDAAGALLVLEGELVELELDPEAQTLARHALRPGSVHPLTVGLVHDVVATTAVPTTSIHVYSPPLAEMGRWDPVTLERVEVEAVVEEAPVLGAVASGRALHPSSGRRRV
jgi:predicted metal-dependent enzyme (double-stranded beta helix superfamily)